MQCSNLVMFRINAKRNKVVNQRKTIYAWFAAKLFNAEIPKCYEVCDGNVTIDISAVDENHGRYSCCKLDVTFTCDKCGITCCPEIVDCDDEENSLTNLINEFLGKISKKAYRKLQDKYLKKHKIE